jgi:hypothetical protein
MLRRQFGSLIVGTIEGIGRRTVAFEEADGVAARVRGGASCRRHSSGVATVGRRGGSDQGIRSERAAISTHRDGR